MKFLGLFIGIDRYSSPSINWLSCARRDAVALSSLFKDNFGNNVSLLTDKEAKHSAIEAELKKLQSCKKEDFVVVSFSGHGTETHELVAYDTDISKLSKSTISLEYLGKLFSKIPAQNLLCILDCCFSGGMGAKALQVDVQSRDVTSVEDLLKQLSGKGRLIITASKATEKAWESQKVGHGLLTNSLISSLLGANEVVKNRKVSVYRMLEYVTQHVIDQSKKIGRVQNPTIKGSLEGEVMWPIFKPGEAYKTAFPDKVAVKVAKDTASLNKFGFPQGLIDAWASSIPSLNKLQIEAINKFSILEGENVVVSAPTSSGKTMIGELAAIRGVLDRKRAIFLFPLKALVNDKLRHFRETYGLYGLRTIRATGDSTSDEILPLMRGQYDICLMTYEKFSAIILANPFVLEQVGTIVVDEVQMIADESRGVNLEFILTLLIMRRFQSITPQLIVLSAVIGDTNGLERWLGARLLRHTERPIPLDEGVIRADGSYRYIDGETGEEKIIKSYITPSYRKGSSQDLIIPLVKKLVDDGKSVIVFRETRGEARGCALYLAEHLSLPPAQLALDSLPIGDPSLSSERLRTALQGGAAFHISDLDTEERQVIEEQFRAVPSSLKVISATTTLAMGVNTPAEVVIIAGLTHPGDKPYYVAEYKNIIGRAGRLGISERGMSFVIVIDSSSEDTMWSNYVLGKPEDLVSKFIASDTDPRSLITRILVAAEQSGAGLSSQEIIQFLEASFGVFQEKIKWPDWTWREDELMTSLKSLQEHKLIEIDKSGLHHLTQLGRLAGEAGVEIESIIRLVDAFSDVNPEFVNDPSLIVATQITKELDDVLFPLNKKSTQKEPQTWNAEIQRQGIPQPVMNALKRSISEESVPTLRAKKAVACLFWITNVPLSQIEDTLTRFGGRYNGAAGPIRSVTSRTCDLLPVTARILELLHPNTDLSIRLRKLLIRLEVGVPPEILEIAEKAGKILSRGNYLKLIEKDLTSVDALEKAGKKTVLECLENNEKKYGEMLKAFENVDNEYKLLDTPILPEYKS